MRKVKRVPKVKQQLVNEILGNLFPERYNMGSDLNIALEAVFYSAPILKLEKLASESDNWIMDDNIQDEMQEEDEIPPKESEINPNLLDLKIKNKNINTGDVVHQVKNCLVALSFGLVRELNVRDFAGVKRYSKAIGIILSNVKVLTKKRLYEDLR